MPPSEPSRVFISYARTDGAALAQRLQKDLSENGFDAWLDTQRLGGGRVWSMEIEGAIKSSGVMIALLSPSAYESEICRSEQLLALDQGNRVIPVLAVKGSDRPVYIYARQYRDFSDEVNYPARLAELLADIRGDATATLPDTYRKTRVTYLTAPPQVANYLERPEALHALRDALFAEHHRQPIALTALAGMGGIGKTVLAKALTEDEVVRRAFPDGIVWITAGRERQRDFIAEMREVAKALGDDLSGYDNPLACENQYRTTIANKAALIVVDDVWSKADIEPLLAESPRSRFLFTTRDAAIGNLVGARDHRADLLDDAQSRALLALWANKPFSELPAVADDIIRECGRLPLALSVLGGMLRGKNAQYWADTLARLCKADISSIRKQLPTGQETFFKAVETSFQSLGPEMQEHYKALAVLLEDMSAPQPILATLWNVETSDARLISNRLVELSLAQWEGATESIRLHDLQLDYVRAQFPDKEALDLIHGALRLSSNVVERDPGQFASQMVGRLVAYEDMPAINVFTKQIAEGSQQPWLRPLRPTLHLPGTGLIRTLEGHSGVLNAVAVTPDGRRAVSASSDKTLKVWDLGTGRELLTLFGHSGSVNSVTVTSDGQRAVSGSSDNTLKVWDLSTGGQLFTLVGHDGSVDAVAVTPDGQLAVSASGDETLKLWDLASGQELRTLIGHSAPVTAVAVTPDGRYAVSTSADETLRLWDLGSGRELRAVTDDTGFVRALAVTPDGKRAVSASHEHKLKVWDLNSGQELRTLTGHTSNVTSVAMMPGGQLVISSSCDRTLRVWDLVSGRELRIFTGHARPVHAVAVTPDGRRAVSASEGWTLKLWDLGTVARNEKREIVDHAGVVNAVVLTPHDKMAISASSDKTLKVWDRNTRRELFTLSGHDASVNALVVTPDGRHAVSASSDQTLKVWDLASGRELRTLAGHTGPVMAVAVTPEGQRAVSASSDQTLKVWDLASGRELFTLSGHDDSVNSVAVTLDGRRAVSASDDHTLKVWELNSGRELHTLISHSDCVNAVAVTQDGKRAVSSSSDCTMRVWELSNGRELIPLFGHSDPVRSVLVTANGHSAVSASDDWTLKVWDLESAIVLATFTCDSGARCCAITDDVSLIIAGDVGGHLHFLRLEEPKAKG